MRINLASFSNYLIKILTTAMMAIVLLFMAQLYLPASRVTHECVRDSNTTSQMSGIELKQGFCQKNEHVEIRVFLYEAVTNVAITSIVVSVPLLILVRGTLLFQDFTEKKNK